MSVEGALDNVKNHLPSPDLNKKKKKTVEIFIPLEVLAGIGYADSYLLV